LKADTEQQKSIMQYLLGQARPEDVSSLEERLVTESEFYDELLMAEDELIDQYLSGDLSESERNSFERHFLLTPERQRKMRFGKVFNKYVTTADSLPDEDPVTEDVPEEARDVPKPPPKPGYDTFLPSQTLPPTPWNARFLPGQNPILSYSLAAALVLIVGTVSWLAWKNWREAAPRDPGKVYAVTLTPGLTTRSEGDDIKRISIPPDLGTLRLRLQLTGDDYPSYRATLVRDGQSKVWTGDHLPALNDAGTKLISADIPARYLTPGDYQIKLAGQPATGSLEDVASYRFRVGR
jgi:hypothetical protein